MSLVSVSFAHYLVNEVALMCISSGIFSLCFLFLMYLKVILGAGFNDR